MVELKETYADSRIHEKWEHAYRGNRHLDRLTDAILERALAAVQPVPGSSFLDAGCGIGAHTRRIAAVGHRCVGVDISPLILRQAAQVTASQDLSDRCDYACCALEAPPFAARQFDVVHCRGVLMHIPDWARALDNLCTLVRPGGAIIVIENNDQSLFARAMVTARKVAGGLSRSRMVRTEGGVELWSEQDGNPFVVRMANIRTLSRRLEENGFELVARFGTSLLEVARASAGWRRAAVVTINTKAFEWNLSPALCKGNVLVARRKG
jgi:2-polyprenyl-3-methyl-5-hydroxy-6-metoxy-1,4-benzoquinol methylase